MQEPQIKEGNIIPQQKDTTIIGYNAVSGLSGITAISPINRVSHVSGITGISPLLNLVSNDFSSYDSNKSYFQDPKLSGSQVLDPIQINNNGQNQLGIEEGDMNTTIRSSSTQNLPQASSQVQDYFNQNNRLQRRGSRPRQKYELRLSIQYKTQIGEYLAVVGNIEELGQWTNFEKCKLKWTEGHFWIAENLIIVNKPYFLYKYVIMEQGEPKIWEQGPNRLADLDVLQDKNPVIGRISSQLSVLGKGQRERSSSPTHKQNKCCEIYDEWEYFKIKFSINDPIEEQLTNQGDYMRIIGSTPKLGSNNAAEMESTEPIRMNRAQRPVEWLIDKYGQKIRPWEITISFKNTELLLPNEIIYNYSKSNSNGTCVVKEREPSRSMIIQPPETYKGELGNQNSIQWKNQQQVWIVNGMIDKADANFLGGLFFDKVGDTNVFVGTYPLREDDVQKMKEAGITGVMNLQTDQDISQRAVPLKKLKETYKQKNIKFVRFPLNDNDEDDFCANLFTGVQYLNNMVNVEGLTVYVHCTSGISRGPALLVMYLCLFKRVKQWKSPYHVSQFIKAFHVNSNPNLRAVQRVIEANLAFQNLQTPVSPDRSQASIKQKSTDRSAIDDQDVDGFYFPQMMDGGIKKQQSISSSSPNKNMLPPRPNRKSAYVKQFVPQHNQNKSMSHYNPKLKQTQTTSGNRSVTPTPITQSKNMQNQSINPSDQTLNIQQQSEIDSQNDKDQKKVMKYHENSPLSLSGEDQNVIKAQSLALQKLVQNQSTSLINQNISGSIIEAEHQYHEETPIVSPRQAIEKHDKIIQELNLKKKQLVDNNLLLEAAMKAAMVVPNQVQNNTDEFQQIINFKSAKDQAKEHLIQEIDARAKRAETLRLKRQQAANQRKQKDLEAKLKSDEKIVFDQQFQQVDENLNFQLATNIDEVQVIENQFVEISSKKLHNQQKILKNVNIQQQLAQNTNQEKKISLVQITENNNLQQDFKNQQVIQKQKEEQIKKQSIQKEVNLFCDIYVDELINNRTILFINEVYGQEIKYEHQKKLEAERIAREQAEKELQRLRNEKMEREYIEKKRQQQQEEERIQKERLKRISEENELEKARLKQMMDEQEIERMRKQLHDEHLKMLWEAKRRQETLKDIQDAEEQELERRALLRIARDKEERIRKLKQEQDEFQKQKLEQLAKDKYLQQEMIEKAEIEAEQLRQQRIKNAQDELERLQNLRKTEEEKLQRIKESYEQEEKQRKIFLEKERQAEKIRRDHEEQIRQIKMQQQQIQLQSQQLIFNGYKQKGFMSQDYENSTLNNINNGSLVNVYYESNVHDQDNSIRSYQRNKSFVEESKPNDQNYVDINPKKSTSDIINIDEQENIQIYEKQQNSNSGATGSNELDQKTILDLSDDKKSSLVQQQATRYSLEDQ